MALLKNDPLVKDVPISGYIVRYPRAQLLIASMMSRQAKSTRWFKPIWEGDQGNCNPFYFLMMCNGELKVVGNVKLQLSPFIGRLQFRNDSRNETPGF